jgi:ubiquitin-conjugating enzyme E2 variant
VPTLALPGDTLADEPHMVLALAPSFLASLWGVVHNAALVSGTTAACAIAAGLVGAELFSGIFHWATDNYGSIDTPIVGPACAAFQGHHLQPWSITHRSTTNNVHKIARAAGPLALLSGSCLKPFLGIAICILFFGQVCAQEAHRWSHVPAPFQPRLIRFLQSSGLMLSSEEHARHHRSPYAEHYCILFGFLNPLLDRSGIFRVMERLVFRFNGVEPNCWTDPIGGAAVRARALGN